MFVSIVIELKFVGKLSILWKNWHCCLKLEKLALVEVKLWDSLGFVIVMYKPHFKQNPYVS